MLVTAIGFILMCVGNAPESTSPIEDWVGRYDEIHRVNDETGWGDSDYILFNTEGGVLNIVASCKREEKQKSMIVVDGVEYIRADMCTERK